MLILAKRHSFFGIFFPNIKITKFCWYFICYFLVWKKLCVFGFPILPGLTVVFTEKDILKLNPTQKRKFQVSMFVLGNCILEIRIKETRLPNLIKLLYKTALIKIWYRTQKFPNITKNCWLSAVSTFYKMFLHQKLQLISLFSYIIRIFQSKTKVYISRNSSEKNLNFVS